MQEPLFKPESRWRPPSLDQLPIWSNHKRISIDVETCDPHLRELGPGVRRGSYICGFSIAADNGPGFYVPIRHEGGDNVEDPGQALRYLRDNCKTFTGEIVGANLSYDLDFLMEEGLDFSQVHRFRDIQIIDPLIYELHKSYSLNEISMRYGVGSKETALLEEAGRAYGINPKASMWRLPARYVGPYGEADAELPMEVLNRQEQRIKELGLEEIYDLESRVIPVLVKMRRRGVRIDQDKLAKIQDWSLREEAAMLEEVHRLTGIRVGVGEVWKAEAMAKPLEHIGIKLSTTEKSGKVSVKKDILEGIDHPVAKALLRARKVNKLRTTFAQSILKHMHNGRIHCTFNQIAYEDEQSGAMKGARFGRLSAENPNLQQQPSRDEFAKEWRSIYIPDEGGIWGCLDYSQQEPRWLTHYAAMMDLDRAREAAQRYIDDPTTDNHDMMTVLVYGEGRVQQMTKDEFKSARGRCKIIFLGLCYGEGGAKLCRDLGLPTRWAIQSGRGRERILEFAPNMHEARRIANDRNNPRIWEAAGEDGQSIIDSFNGNVPYVKQLSDKAAARAKSQGFIITVGGRRCNFPLDESGNFDWTHKALNRLIQGSSADQTKTAMVELDDAGFDLQLQVHDEFDTTLASVEQGRAMAEIMKSCMPSRVPFKVDLEVGDNWGYIKGVD